jgi:uncharacterized membrane protein
MGERFLTEGDRDRIAVAIRDAEAGTSGEIRVHIERRCGGDALARARVVFHELGMGRTASGTGVLIYIATADHRFAIFGDRAIDARIGAAQWQAICDAMSARFREGRFADGICEAIARVGAVLHASFPRAPGDTNELPDAPSFGE